MRRLGRFARGMKRAIRDVLAYLDFKKGDNAIVRRSDFRGCRQPVLLLYGFLSTRRTLEVLEQRLRRDAHCVFSINLGGLGGTFNTRGIDALAELVRCKVERMYARYDGLGPLIVIGHSKGGLIARHYVAKLGGDRRVSALITLGTPHNGTPMAYLGVAFLGWFARSLWQMMPVSRFIRDLARAGWPAHVRLCSIYSPADRITPVSAARLPTSALPSARNVEIPDCGHREYLFRKRVYRAIRDEIREATGSSQGQPRAGVAGPREAVKAAS